MDERLNLVRRAVRRKPGAFETLMEQEKEYLYKMAFLYCREEQMALDTVAETVAKAYVGIGKLKNPEPGCPGRRLSCKKRILWLRSESIPGKKLWI